MNSLSFDRRPLWRRRAFLAAGVASAAVSCRRVGARGYPGYAIIAAAGDACLSVIDLMRFRLKQTIALEAEPRAVLAGADGNTFVLTPSNGSLHHLLGLRLLQTHRWADSLATATLSADGGTLLAIADPSREFLVASARHLGSVTRYKLAERPQHLTAGSSGYAAISTGSGGSVELFHVASGRRWTRTLGAELGKLVFRVDGQILLVANLQDRSLVALSVPTLQTIAELPLAMRPDNLCSSIDGGQLFISGEGMDGVAIVFPYRVLQVDQTVLAGRDPGVMAASDAPPYLFVASASGSDVCILDIDNRRVIGLVDVAQQPGYITLTPDYQYALILNEHSGDMAVIHVGSIRQNFIASQYKGGAALFTMLPVGDRPVHAVVVPDGLHSV